MAGETQVYYRGQVGREGDNRGQVGSPGEREDNRRVEKGGGVTSEKVE